MIHKVYIHDGGGAGDIPANQLRCFKGWGHVEAFKKKFPNSKIRAIITSCSVEGAKYIKYNPYIDEIKELPWVNPHRPWPGLDEHIIGYKPLHQAAKELMPGIPGQIPPVYLSPSDKIIVDNVTKQGKFAFIHPFAGTSERMVFPVEKYPELIDRLIDEMGYNVVAMGGTYKQLANQGRKDIIRKEELAYERPGLFNLVNKANMRIGIYLALHAERWIGTWSCYVWPGFIKDQRMVLFMPAEYYGQASVCNKNQQRIIRIPLAQKDFSVFAEQAINHLKE